MKEYLELFIDKEYPEFIDKYLTTNTLNRLKTVTQFCGCDYTNLYHPRFLYTRFDHSLVVAHMTWHFTHDKKETIIALLHDIGTPCFAHCIDYVFGDYVNQESSEKQLTDVLKHDNTILKYLEKDGIKLDDFENLSNYPILENKTPKLCADRLDGVLATCYTWLHTHSYNEIKEVYENCVILKNEDNLPEIGWNNREIAEKFVEMVYQYAKELQGNKDKFVMKYISEIVKIMVQKNLITLNDLYEKKEEEICNILEQNITSWKNFQKANDLVETEEEPQNTFYISFETKKRNAIPLVQTKDGVKRITESSKKAEKKYNDLKEYKAKKYAYIKDLIEL